MRGSDSTATCSPWMLHRWNSPRRGGYHYRAESRGLADSDEGPPSLEQLDAWWARFCTVYERLVPIAEDRDIKLAIHPSDSPLPDTPLGGLGFHKVIDAFPQPPSWVSLLLRHPGRGRGACRWYSTRFTTTGARAGSSWCIYAMCAAA